MDTLPKRDENKWNISLSTIKLPLLFIFIFYSVAFWRYFATGKSFYIYNFIYLGTSLAIGIFLSGALPKKYVLWGRRITQLLIGAYILGYVGFIRHENMQIEGFFFYLFAGVFAVATLHYFIAKIIGPLIFGRGWCGWACWTAMILDLLPWKKTSGRLHNLGIIRYIHFFFSLGLVSYFWFIIGTKDIFNHSITEVYWLAIGNIFYYVIGISLAALLKDNRAFCKYVCPVPVLQKLTSRFSLLKVSIDNSKCIDCHLCEKNCPMDIELLKYKNEGKRILSTECILCTTCQDVCPQNAIKITFGFDSGERKEYLKYR
ncbi:MAG: 4Fe-4S binding protein [Synergistetes bacterium]|nr:4Fe-4S binding protein [Synergistota bacterium]